MWTVDDCGGNEREFDDCCGWSGVREGHFPCEIWFWEIWGLPTVLVKCVGCLEDDDLCFLRETMSGVIYAKSSPFNKVIFLMPLYSLQFR